MSFLDDFMRRIEQHDLPELRDRLKPLESGQMHVGERKYGAIVWYDTTPRQINILKQRIADYEELLAKYRAAAKP